MNHHEEESQKKDIINCKKLGHSLLCQMGYTNFMAVAKQISGVMFDKILTGRIQFVVLCNRTRFIKGSVKSAIFKDGICYFIENVLQLVYKAKIVKCGKLWHHAFLLGLLLKISPNADRQTFKIAWAWSSKYFSVRHNKWEQPKKCLNRREHCSWVQYVHLSRPTVH